MHKKTFAAALALTLSSCVLAQHSQFSIQGKVVNEKGKGIPHVVVNDGVHFTTTDSEGNWAFSTDTVFSKFVSISTPSEYELPTVKGLSRFYLPIRDVVKSKDNHFTLKERKAKSESFYYLAISDPQVLNESELSRWKNETVMDLHHVADSLKRKKEVIGVTLGDLVFDNMHLFAPYAKTCESIGIPMFQTIGNHDFDKHYQDLHNMRTGSPLFAEHYYYQYFGPTDYSFNIGKIHVITLKNINYVGHRHYIEDITDTQLAWLEKDLSYIPKGSTVFLNMHAAAWNKVQNAHNISNGKELAEALKGYDVHVFCGHTHYFQNVEVNSSLYQHNIAAACGAWWAGNYSVCGAPNGYLIVEVNGTTVKWHYKPTKGNVNEQFHLYTPGEFRSQPGLVVANIWDYDSHCKITYYEDGVPRGMMERFTDTDENYIRQQNKIGRKVENGPVTSHLFRIKPTQGTKEITVVFTNRFGEQYSQTRKL